SFSDHFSQPALFYRSLEKWEQAHVADAYSFELGKCMHDHIKERMLWLIAQINKDLAKKVAENLGMKIPKDIQRTINQARGADSNVEDFQPGPAKNYLDKSKALSQAHTKFNSIVTRQIAVLIADGFSIDDFAGMKEALEKEGALIKIVAPTGGTIQGNDGKK